MGETSATGVAFTRNPSTGAKELYGEYLINAQGEDVVAGIRTPQSITIQGKEQLGSILPSMQETMPEVFLELEKIYKKLEELKLEVEDSGLERLPLNTKEVTKESFEKIQKLIDALESDDDVQKVYHNLEWNEAFAE
jgi:pyruvate,orthophosphate dikinase